MAGTPVGWVVFFTGLLMSGFGAVMYLSHELWGAPVAIASLAVSLWALVVQIRFSLRQSARVLGVTLLVCGGITLLAGTATNTTVLAIGAGIAAVGAALAAFGWLTGNNPLPHLTHVAQVPHFYESDGVHFAVGWSDKPLPRRGTFFVEAIAQNVMTAPRALVVRLDGVSEQAFETVLQRIDLAPGAIVKLRIPFRLTALAEGTLVFAVDLSGRGDLAGIPLRREQGAEYVADVLGANLLGAATFLTLGVGTFRFGGSKTVRLPIDEQAPLADAVEPLGSESLYQPAADDLERARRL